MTIQWWVERPAPVAARRWTGDNLNEIEEMLPLVPDSTIKSQDGDNLVLSTPYMGGSPTDLTVPLDAWLVFSSGNLMTFQGQFADGHSPVTGEPPFAVALEDQP